MPLQCPHCGHSINPSKNTKPGRYTPKCPKCTKNFLIIVPEGGGEWTVSADLNTGKSSGVKPVTIGTAATDMNATGQFVGPDAVTPPVIQVPKMVIGTGSTTTGDTGYFNREEVLDAVAQAKSKPTDSSKSGVIGKEPTKLATDPPTDPRGTRMIIPGSGDQPSSVGDTGLLPNLPKKMIVPGDESADPKIDTIKVKVEGKIAEIVNSGQETGVYAPVPAPSAETTGVFSEPKRTEPAPSAETTGVFSDPETADSGATGAFEVAEPAAPAKVTIADKARRPRKPADMEQTGAFPNNAELEKTGVLKSAKTTVEGQDETIAGKLPDDSDEVSGSDELGIPRKLGGYEVVKELGRGGMGAVYLARQISLDRPVALKVMNERWARDPGFLVRFTREAYAAAQLVHHNIVQVYDIGEQNGLNFFSMEFVDGKSLADILKKEQKLDPEVAVGYILQAARGLKFAHDRGMIHRDIKPDNLMLNSQGVVKVADLGLVKTAAMTAADDQMSLPGSSVSGTPTGGRTGLGSLPSDVTHAHIAMGTPAYMSPEQSRDAASVDHRADIYSLGCTLYVLLTGRPPFAGTTAIEVISKHAREPLVPPEAIVKHVPKTLSAIIQKMMAKNADDRYRDLGELIGTLEGWLGIQSTGPFTPKEEHVNILEECVKTFNEAPSAKLHSVVLSAFFGLTSLGIIAALFFSLAFACGLAAFAGSAIVSYFVITGISEKTYLFRRVREYAFGFSWGDIGLSILGGLVGLGILALSGLWLYCVPMAVAGTGLAALLHFTLDRKIRKERAPAIERCEDMIKRLRISGLEEEAIRHFIAKYSGRRWEEFFEALFGFEAKLTTRVAVARIDEGSKREKYAAWREPIVAWIDELTKRRKEARERALLQKLEEKNLVAQGVDKNAAREQAEAVADLLVEQAAQIKEADATAKTAVTANAPKVNIKQILASAAKPPKKLPKPKVNPLKAGFDLVFSAKFRFVLGLLLILLTVNGAKGIPGIDTMPALDALKKLFGGSTWGSGFFNSPTTGLAGLFLIVSVILRATLANAVLLAATIVLCFWSALGVPEFFGLARHQYALVLGGLLGVIAVCLTPRK